MNAAKVPPFESGDPPWFSRYGAVPCRIVFLVDFDLAMQLDLETKASRGGRVSAEPVTFEAAEPVVARLEAGVWVATAIIAGSRPEIVELPRRIWSLRREIDVADLIARDCVTLAGVEYKALRIRPTEFISLVAATAALSHDLWHDRWLYWRHIAKALPQNPAFSKRAAHAWQQAGRSILIALERGLLQADYDDAGGRRLPMSPEGLLGTIALDGNSVRIGESLFRNVRVRLIDPSEAPVHAKRRRSRVEAEAAFDEEYRRPSREGRRPPTTKEMQTWADSHLRKSDGMPYSAKWVEARMTELRKAGT